MDFRGSVTGEACDFTFARRTQRAQWGLALMLMPGASIGSSVANKGGSPCWTRRAVEHTDNEPSCKLYLTVEQYGTGWKYKSHASNVGKRNVGGGWSRASFWEKVLPELRNDANDGSPTFSYLPLQTAPLSPTNRCMDRPIVILVTTI